MADADTTPSNLFFLAAATPALAQSGDAEWDEAFSSYLRADALARADAYVGAYALANERFDRESYSLAERYGKAFKTNEAAQPEWQATWEALSAVETAREETFLVPMWDKACKLALTPAPNLACALFKIELAKREDLHNDRDMPVPVMDLVVADMARLQEAA